MAKISQPIVANDEVYDVFYEDLGDIMNDVPSDILNADGDNDSDADDSTDDDQGDADDDDDQDDAGTDDDDSDDDQTDSDDDDDYVTADDDDDKPEKPVAAAPAPPAAVTNDEASRFILAGLSKIPVNIIVTGTDGKDVTQRVEVYGFGDLPANFKGYASPLEGESFRGAVTAQEIKAQRLQEQFTQRKTAEQAQAGQAEFAKRENKAIAGDLMELRKEGLFPKFKGTPNTKEFNESDGAKEFDKVVAFMNKRNEQYLQKSNDGAAYRHIGFREAYEILHGPDPKAAERSQDRARKKIAGKVISKNGSRAQVTKTGVARVNNMTDLADEFTAAVSS